MRDIPFFTTEYGTASLTLSQIPYTHRAYIRIHSAASAALFLDECIRFCRSAGADTIFATGHEICDGFPMHDSLIKMQVDKNLLGTSSAMLFPVTDHTVSYWTKIYQEKSKKLTNAVWMDIAAQQKVLTDGDAYFVHQDGKLLGTGKASNGQIQWICSVAPGAGKDILCALAGILPDDTIYLEVSSQNRKAIDLYTSLGFVATEELVKWHIIK